MPCEGGYSGEQQAEMRAIRQSLCYILTCYETGWSFMDALDDNPWLDEWWKKHKRQDAEERERERLIADREARRAEVLATLTPEQRAALGFNREDVYESWR